MKELREGSQLRGERERDNSKQDRGTYTYNQIDLSVERDNDERGIGMKAEISTIGTT